MVYSGGPVVKKIFFGGERGRGFVAPRYPLTHYLGGRVVGSDLHTSHSQVWEGPESRGMTVPRLENLVPWLLSISLDRA